MVNPWLASVELMRKVAAFFPVSLSIRLNTLPKAIPDNTRKSPASGSMMRSFPRVSPQVLHSAIIGSKMTRLILISPLVKAKGFRIRHKLFTVIPKTKGRMINTWKRTNLVDISMAGSYQSPHLKIYTPMAL